MNFHTIYPYIILICFIKIILFWKKDVNEIRTKKMPVIYISAFLLTAFITLVLLCEKTLVADGMIHLLILCWTVVILYWCIVTILVQYRFHLYILLGPMLFGLFSSVGNLTIYDDFGISGFLLSLSCWSLLFGCALECLYRLSFHYRFFLSPKEDYRKWGLFTFGVSCLIDGVFLLAYYPGVMTYDALIQMCQATGGFPYSNHHPWLHTIFIKGIYELGLLLFHNSNKAYALYSVFSISILSLALAVAVSYLRKMGLRTWLMVLVIFLYLASPINQMYSITMWKDIPFSSCLLLFIVLLCNMCGGYLEQADNNFLWMLFIPCSFFVCFLRSNGLYVFLGMIPFIIWRFWKERKYAIGAISIVLLLGIIYKGPIFSYYEVEEPDTIESLSIPAQQIAAVFYYDGTITQKQIMLLNNIVDTSLLAQAYATSPGCSDDVKDLVRSTNNQVYITTHKMEFIRLYMDLFMANKRIFVTAFVKETYGYWYHQVIFPSSPWATYIEQNGLGISRDSKVSDSVRKCFADYLSMSQQFLDQYCSVGLFVYVFFASFIIALEKRSKYLLAYLPVFGIWCTLLMATPVYADIRYAYALYIALPFLVIMSVHRCDIHEKCEQEKN